MKRYISKDLYKLAENIFSMISLRALEYILSFIIVPYLLFVLGPAKTGLIALVQSWISYPVLITTYGFDKTASRDLANANPTEYNCIFSNYLSAQVLLGVVSSFSMVIVMYILVVLGYELDFLLIGLVYLSVIGNILFPIWFYQGIQEMRYITILNLIGRLFCLGGLFYFVRTPNDYLWAALFQSIPSCIAGIVSIYYLRHKYISEFVIPSIQSIIGIYRSGWHIFAASFVINLYTSTTIIILGALTNSTVVGYYTAADKLVGCVRRFISAVNTAVYPYIIRLLKEDSHKAYLFLQRQIGIYAVGGIIFCCILSSFAHHIITILLGTQYMDSINIFMILAWMPVCIAISNVFGEEILLAFHKDKEYTKILIVAAIVNTVGIFPLTIWLGAVGTAWTQIITESLVMILMGYSVYRSGLVMKR